MACFLVPLTEAVVVSVVDAVLAKRNAADVVKEAHAEAETKVSALHKNLSFLKQMLFGGSFLLAIEHIYHGEVSFVPPFLTAMKTPEEIPVMLHEMATVGVGMALLTTAVWGVGLAVARMMKKSSGNQLAGAL